MASVRLTGPTAVTMPCRLARFEDDHYGIVLRPFEIRVDEAITSAFRRFHNWDVSLL